MKDNRKEGEKRAERRGGGKEEGEGKAEYCTTDEPTLECWRKISVRHFHVWPHAEMKGKRLPKGKPLFSKCELPIFRIRRKSERVSSAGHSQKSSAYGGYFNFLIPSFL